MRRTRKSIGYKDASGLIDEIDKEVMYRELWKFSYASRHIQQSLWKEKRLDEEIEKTLKWSTDITEKYCPEATTKEDYNLIILEFLNCLIYGYHRREINDGYMDLQYEMLLLKYDNPIEKINVEELNVVANLHTLSHKFGYSILELYYAPDHTLFRDMFVFSNDQKPSFTPPLFKFPEKDNCPKGIQIACPDYDNSIKESWDLVIYYSEGDTINQIKRSLDRLWYDKDKPSIGKKSNHDIALYIDTKSCNKTHVITVLELQIGLKKFEKSGRIAIFKDGYNNPPMFLNNHTEPNRFMANTVDAFRLSEKLTEKHWDPDQNNVRRSIGIYLWDQKNSPEPTAPYLKPMVRDTITSIHQINPSALNHYRSGYTELMKRKSSIDFNDEFIRSIIREMERDYKLTDYCIQNADYMYPSQV
jgi:hypothetical protein